MKEVSDSETRQHVRDIADLLRKQIGVLFEHTDRANPINLAEIHMMITDLDEALDKTNELVDDNEMRFNNHYRCDNGHKMEEWDSEWSCQCDDECPECGDSVSPYSSDDVRENV